MFYNKIYLWNHNSEGLIKKFKTDFDFSTCFKKANDSKKPNVIILHTIKGKGVKEFENDPIWHARQLKGKEIIIGKKRLGIKWEEYLEK